VESSSEHHELYHDIFGSVLDRTELTPYLLRNCEDYPSAMGRATMMMGNRGFYIVDGELGAGEAERAAAYVSQSLEYMKGALFPVVATQLHDLALIGSPQKGLYDEAADSIANLENLLTQGELSTLIREDPRHLFLLASSAKYPHLFRGHPSGPDRVPPRWRMAGCAVLKMCHLIKAIEEDSQDIYDYTRLGLFFESHGIPLTDLFNFSWSAPGIEPEDENARRAFVKLSSFFGKLHSSITMNREQGTIVFNSGDGVQVDIVDVKARLKSPESMFAKLGKEAKEEAYNIRDILAVTFLLKKREDSLTLFHALQKQGVILQENTASTSITQTLYDTPEEMTEAVRCLMGNLARREGNFAEPSPEEVRSNSKAFFNALSTNAGLNPDSSGQHRKFQCKIKFSVPVQYDRLTHRVLIPGTADVFEADDSAIITRQHTLPIELRISDIHSWELSELTGDAHHDAYKCRQYLSLLNRLFSPLISFPEEAFPQLRKDQNRLFSCR
jgi:uncharacterized protein (TIGR04552 family)